MDALGDKAQGLGGVVRQGVHLALQGLAVGFHGARIPAALGAGGFQGFGQQVIADGQLLDFIPCQTGIVGQQAIDVDAGIGELLDVHRRCLAHVGDLLEVGSHPLQFLVAAARGADCIAQGVDDLPGLLGALAGGDQQPVGGHQPRHVKGRFRGVGLDGVQSRVGGFGVSQQVFKGQLVVFHLAVELQAGGNHRGHHLYGLFGQLRQQMPRRHREGVQSGLHQGRHPGYAFVDFAGVQTGFAVDAEICHVSFHLSNRRGHRGSLAERVQWQTHRSASSGRSSEVCLAQRSEFSSITLDAPKIQGTARGRNSEARLAPRSGFSKHHP